MLLIIKIIYIVKGITNNASIKRLLDVNTKETLFQKLQERISKESNDLIDSYASMFVLGIKDVRLLKIIINS